MPSLTDMLLFVFADVAILRRCRRREDAGGLLMPLFFAA